MFIKWFVFIIGFICLGTAASPSKPVLDIQHWTTSNGAQVYFVRATEIPMLDIQVAFAAGSVYDGQQYGIAQFTNAMLDQGAKQLSADVIADNFAKIGALYSNNVTRDVATVGLRTLTKQDYLQAALKTFIDVLTSPDFPQKAFNRVKNITLLSIRQEQQFPSIVANRAFFTGIYGKQGYAHSALGVTESVNKLSINNLKDFYQRYYVANNAIIAMVGDVSLAQAKRLSSEITEHLAPGKPAPKLALATAKNCKTLSKHIHFPAKQTTILIGQLGIRRTNPDRFALYVGNYILGGGMTSRLFNQVRDKQGLAYGIGSGFGLLQYRGPFIISLQTRNNKAQQALQLTQQILASFIAQGPTTKELTRAKQHIIGAFPLGVASNADILANLVSIGFYRLPLNYLDTYRDRIKSVTTEEITAAFKKYVYPKCMLTVTVGNEPQVKAESQ